MRPVQGRGLCLVQQGAGEVRGAIRSSGAAGANVYPPDGTPSWSKSPAGLRTTQSWASGAATRSASVPAACPALNSRHSAGKPGLSISKSPVGDGSTDAMPTETSRFTPAAASPSATARATAGKKVPGAAPGSYTAAIAASCPAASRATAAGSVTSPSARRASVTS